MVEETENKGNIINQAKRDFCYVCYVKLSRKAITDLIFYIGLIIADLLN